MDWLLSFLREAFLTTFEMSGSVLIVAFVVVLVVMLLRRIRVPQCIPGLLWLLVAVRMLTPVLPVSPVSVMNIPILEDAAQTMSGSLRESLHGDFEVAVDVPGGRNEFQEIVDAGVEPETTEFGWRAVFYTGVCGHLGGWRFGFLAVRPDFLRTAIAPSAFCRAG